MKLSEIVRRYREEHGLSIRQFAKQCDISHSAIANIESETNSYGEPYIPQLGTINKVAFGMGIPARELLDMMDGVSIDESPADDLRDELKDNPELRTLLSASSKLSKEDLQFVIRFVEKMNRE